MQSKVESGFKHIIVTHPGREPYIIWGNLEAVQLAIDICEAIKHSWKESDENVILESWDRCD